MTNNRRRLLAGGIFVLLHGWGRASPVPAVAITVSTRQSGDRHYCLYELTNHTPQTIVAFALGGNENLAGPYQLTTAPLGFDPDTGAGQAVQGPDEWEASLLREPAGSTFAVEWQAKDLAKALLPEKTEKFELAYAEAPHCKEGHWTAITRDSQVHSGLLASNNEPQN